MDFVGIQRHAQSVTYGSDPSQLVGAERARFVRDMILAATVELYEVMDCFEWKPWHSGNPYYGELHDEEKWEIIDEFGDVFCFLGNIAAVAGLTTDEVWEGFRRKVALNEKRHANTQAERD